MSIFVDRRIAYGLHKSPPPSPDLTCVKNKLSNTPLVPNTNLKNKVREMFKAMGHEGIRTARFKNVLKIVHFKRLRV